MNIFTLDDAERIPKGTAVSVGMFDGVHRGHRQVLNALHTFAKEIGTEPLAITFDRHPRYVLAGENNDFFLLNTNAERYRIMEECGIDNLLEIHFTQDTALLPACEFARKYLVEMLGIKGLLLGYDNMFGNKSANDFDKIPKLARECGFEIRSEKSLLCDGIEISSTQIRKALSRGDIALANRMLGYNYQISGTVVHGREIGRTLHFPTANIMCTDLHKMLPADGVYCVLLTLDNQAFEAICNIGSQPTFNSFGRTVEAHILDFDGYIYGKEITLTFIEKIRDIRKFDSTQELANQLNKDANVCRDFFRHHNIQNEKQCERF